MTIRIGEVVAVHGVKVTLRIDDDSSKEVLFYNGERFKGVSIREYVLIQRGFRDLVCIVEGEHLDESRIDSSNGKSVYIRRVDVRPIGYFHGESFQHGIKYLPMIRDPAFLMPERRVRPRETASSVVMVLSISARSRSLISRWMKKL